MMNDELLLRNYELQMLNDEKRESHSTKRIIQNSQFLIVFGDNS